MRGAFSVWCAVSASTTSGPITANCQCRGTGLKHFVPAQKLNNGAAPERQIALEEAKCFSLLLFAGGPQFEQMIRIVRG